MSLLGAIASHYVGTVPTVPAVTAGWSAASVGGGTAAISITKSALGTVANGNLLVAFCTGNNTVPTWASTGWTSYIGNNGQAILYRIADGSEGATLTFTRSGSTTGVAVAQVARITGANTTTPFDTVGTNLFTGTGGSQTLTAITTSGTDNLLLQFLARVVTGAQTWSPPGGTTKQFDSTGVATQTLPVAVGDEVVGSGSTGNRVWTIGGLGANRGAMVSVNPA